MPFCNIIWLMVNKNYFEAFTRRQTAIGLAVLMLYSTGYLTPWLPFMRVVANRWSTFAVIVVTIALLSPQLVQAFRAFRKDTSRLILWTFGTFVALFVAAILWSVVQSVLIQTFDIPYPAHSNTANIMVELRTLPVLGSILLLLGSTILGPIFEELTYRGILFRSLERLSGILAHIFTAALFGFQHVVVPVFIQHDSSAWVAIGNYVFFSLALTFIYTRTRTLAPGIIAHSLFNCIGVLISTRQ